MPTTTLSTLRTYVAIDLKSFYASVECMDRGLDPLSTRLVVADESRTDKTICLAVSPALKAYGIPGRPRLFEVQQKVKQINWRRAHTPKADGSYETPLDFIIAKPRMARYIEVSTKIYGIYLRYVSAEDIHVYSIDEVFMDVTPYLDSYKMTAHELAMTMIREVLRETGITATAGIGTNLYLAKVAMDIVAKHIPADKDGVRIAELNEMSYREQLWDHEPLTSFWRVGHGIADRLKAMGINTMGQLARRSLTLEEWLYREFGVNAELLIDHAWGWEPATIAAIKAYKPRNHSMGQGQVLQCGYDNRKARVVVKEMADQLALDLLVARMTTPAITLHISFDRENLTRPDIAEHYHGPVSMDHYGRMVPKSVNGTERLPLPSSSSQLITEAAMSIFDRQVDPRLLVRRINITAVDIMTEEEAQRIIRQPRQLDLFADNEQIAREEQKTEERLAKERRMQEALLKIKNQFGKNAILKGTSYEEGATARERNQQIGGHHE